jgi:hypothetical protein
VFLVNLSAWEGSGWPSQANKRGQIGHDHTTKLQSSRLVESLLPYAQSIYEGVHGRYSSITIQTTRTAVFYITSELLGT